MSVLVPSDYADTIDEIILHPHHDCPPIDRCCQAWYDMFEKALSQGASRMMARLRANAAYRFAMPPLNSPENVRDFVACVIHGHMAHVILPDLATRLFYGAQVATSIVKVMQKPTPGRQQQPEGSSQPASQAAPLPTVSLSDCEEAPDPLPQDVPATAPKPAVDPANGSHSENRPPSPTVPLSDCEETPAAPPHDRVETRTEPNHDPASCGALCALLPV